MNRPKAALIMGSDSDFEKLKGCVTKLKEFDIQIDVNVISAHRTPDRAAEFAKNAEANGIEVIICAACGCYRGAHHCAGYRYSNQIHLGGS